MSSVNYQMFPSDFSAWPAVISLQNILGAGMPAINDAAAVSFKNWIDGMAGGTYGNIVNANLKSWTDTLFTSIEGFQTSYGNHKFPDVYLANRFREWTSATPDCYLCLNGSDYFLAFSSGATSDSNKRYYGDCLTWHVGPWGRPGKPDSWSASILSVFTTWGTSGVPSDLANVANLFSTSTWSNASNMKTTALPLWTSQASALSDLQGQTTLDDNECVFLLYLLCSLGTGNADQQMEVQKIISFPTNSFELPNDTFIDTLIYYVMMLWVDPLGNYTFNSDQIKGCLNTLNGVLVSTDAGTAAIKTAVGKYLKILNAAPTYPMTDPYNPNTGFTTRQSDMLAAINSVWPCK